MKSLSRFEANLMAILYAILGERSPSSVLMQLEHAQERPSCLTRGAVDMAEEALRKGMVRWLASIQGWQKEKFLRRGEPSQGRLWERSPPDDLAITFSGHTLDFLMTVTAGNARAEKFSWKPKGKQPLELGDWIFLYRAVDVLRRNRLGLHWMKLPALASHPLLGLSMPQATTGDFDYSTWMNGSRALVLEAMQDKLALDWMELERSKIEIKRHEVIVALGARQASVLNAFMDACEQAERLDLSRFLLTALRTIVDTEDVRRWVSMDLSGLKLAQRSKVYEKAAEFLNVARRFRKWHGNCQATGYFDEGYGAAQLWLSNWERYDGERVTDRALELREELLAF